MKKIILIVCIVLVLAVVGSLAWLYTGQQTQAKEKIFQKIPLPAALVGNKIVNMKDILARYALAESLYKDQEGFNGQELKTTILNKLITDAQTAGVANKHKVTLSAADINDQYQRLVEEVAEGDMGKLEELIKENYKLSIDEFKTKVVVPELLKAVLTVWYNEQENLNQNVYKKIAEAKAQLDQNTPFGDVVNAYSEDENSKAVQGDVGFVEVKDLLPEFHKVLDTAKDGEVALVHSRYGHHLIKVLARDNSAENNGSRIHIQEIFFDAQGFDDWLRIEQESINVRRFLNFT
jgi:hypothetical protein